MEAPEAANIVSNLREYKCMEYWLCVLLLTTLQMRGWVGSGEWGWQSPSALAAGLKLGPGISKPGCYAELPSACLFSLKYFSLLFFSFFFKCTYEVLKQAFPSHFSPSIELSILWQKKQREKIRFKKCFWVSCKQDGRTLVNPKPRWLSGYISAIFSTPLLTFMYLISSVTFALIEMISLNGSMSTTSKYLITYVEENYYNGLLY